ncbi:MAG TPA: STAS domain-containing protein [Terriglobales bacterium]|nr:STAS domain-containing protein [Terriglobales bacterium]
MLNFAIDNFGDMRVLRCAGRITIEAVDTLLDAAIIRPLVQMTVLDLKEVSALDAAGLGMLLSIRMWAKATHTKLKLMNLVPEVEKLLELTNLRSAFEICSVRDMLELMCRAAQQSARTAAVLEQQLPAHTQMVPNQVAV